MKLENKKVLVVGLGRSGIAAAQILRSRNALVTVCDHKAADETGIDIESMQRAGIEIYTGDIQGSRHNYDLLIASPGIALISSLSRGFCSRHSCYWRVGTGLSSKEGAD